MLTASLPARAAIRAASLTRLARSAPTEPGVRLATCRRSTSVAQLDVADVDLEDRLAADDVGPIDHHGAVEAAGPQQGRVERFRPVGRRHDDDAAVGVEAVHLDEQLVERLLALVVAAHELPPRVLPRASSSSMKMMHGARFSAWLNRSRTRAAPTPTNISTKSEPDRLKNGTSASPATALASSVLPVPGGPTSSTPLGMRPPSAWYLPGS